MKKEKCKACDALRKGTTWVGEPPKCAKHRKKLKMEYYGNGKVSFAGNKSNYMG